MPTRGRIPREEATAVLVGLLSAICRGGDHADCVTAVYVFGSYARGAPRVGDVDIDIEYDARLNDAVHHEMLDLLVAGRDWNAPFRKALKPGRRLQVMFQRVEMLAEPVLVYRAGDQLGDAIERVDAIKTDPGAGRAVRDPVHPSIDPVADDLTRPSRILLSELADAGLVSIDVVELADASDDDIGDKAYSKRVRMRWRSPTSPLRRAARAAGCYLENLGVDLKTVVPMPKDTVETGSPEWVVDCREAHLGSLVTYCGYHGVRRALFVLHPQRKRPLRALKLSIADPAQLPTVDLAGWLSKRAPQIHRIG